MPAAVTFQSVSRHFGEVRAVDNIDLVVEGGCLFCNAGSLGLRKDDLPQTDCRLRAADIRPYRDFRRNGGGVFRLTGETSIRFFRTMRCFRT